MFSRVNDTLRVELYDRNRSGDVSINEQMVLEGFATKCEEPYLSKVIILVFKTFQSFVLRSEVVVFLYVKVEICGYLL